MTTNSRAQYCSESQLQVAIDNLIVARFPSSSSLRENAEAVTELLHDSIEEFASRTGLSSSRFNEAYASAVKMTIATLDKPSLRGVCRFQSLPARAALRWLKSRILNNVKTVLTDPRSKEWLGHFDREEVDVVSFGTAEIEAELARLTLDQSVHGLEQLFKHGADVGELEYLCTRLGIDLEGVIGRQEMPVICEKTACGNAQMAFDF